MKSIKLIFSIVWPIALMIIGLYLFLLLRSGAAFNFGKTEYAETTAECVSVGHDTQKGTKRFQEGKANEKDEYILIYNYTYRVDGITYQAAERDTRELDDYQSYQKDIEDSQNRIGDIKTIYYDPEKPENYSFYYEDFDEAVSGTNSVIGIMAVLCIVVMLPVIILLVIVSSVLRKRRG